MKIKIMSKFDYQILPKTNNMIEVSESELKKIGKTKCFDVDNKCIIDYNNSEILLKETNETKIAELKAYLDTTWRWKNERHNAELEEIKLGIRETTTQTTEEIIFDRKEKVDEINSLES